MKKTSCAYFILFILLFACKKDEINFSELSKSTEIEREQAFPLVSGKFKFDDLVPQDFDSLIIMNQDTVMLYLIEGVKFEDTISLGDLESTVDIEFFNLHYTFINQFPIGIDIKLYLYDSIQKIVIDSIPINEQPGEIFLPAAPLLGNGLVDEAAVEEQVGTVVVSKVLAEKLINETSHLIFVLELPKTEGFVRIIDRYSLTFKFGAHFKATYKGNLNI